MKQPQFLILTPLLLFQRISADIAAAITVLIAADIIRTAGTITSRLHRTLNPSRSREQPSTLPSRYSRASEPTTAGYQVPTRSQWPRIGLWFVDLSTPPVLR